MRGMISILTRLLSKMRTFLITREISINKDLVKLKIMSKVKTLTKMKRKKVIILEIAQKNKCIIVLDN